MQDDWENRLAQAFTPDAVLVAVEEFIASWQPGDLALLPEDCRPPRLSTADDIVSYAFAVVSRQCERSKHSEQLNRMAAFLAGASQRLSQLSALARSQRDQAKLTL